MEIKKFFFLSYLLQKFVAFLEAAEVIEHTTVREPACYTSASLVLQRPLSLPLPPGGAARRHDNSRSVVIVVVVGGGSNHGGAKSSSRSKVKFLQKWRRAEFGGQVEVVIKIVGKKSKTR